MGVSDKVEIWNRDKWEEYMNSNEFNSEAVAEIMEELGI